MQKSRVARIQAFTFTRGFDPQLLTPLPLPRGGVGVQVMMDAILPSRLDGERPGGVVSEYFFGPYCLSGDVVTVLSGEPATVPRGCGDGSTDLPHSLRAC